MNWIGLFISLYSYEAAAKVFIGDDPRMISIESQTINTAHLREFFRNNQWYYWLTEEEIKHLLDTSVYAAIAVEAGRIVGFVLITGDGRVNTELDSLVVDSSSRGQGIGKSLMESAIARIEELTPHYFQIKVKYEDLEHFYAQFGFEQEEGQIVLSYSRIKQRTAEKAGKCP